MLFNETTFIGIDPTAGKQPMAYAALDRDLNPLALGEGDLDAVTAYVGGQQAAFVAVNAPRRPNQGLLKRPEIRDALHPVPRPGRWEGFRVAEYQLYQHNIRTPRTRAQKDKCPAWMQVGFDLYKRLESLDYKPYPQSDSSRQWLEVYPHAAFSVLLGCQPFPKNTFEGRVQRQLLLHNQGLQVPDPMRIFEEITRYRLLQGILPLDGLYTARELDALVAAFTAWVAATTPEAITRLGRPEEGEIILPGAELQSKY
ncbi:MAG TPA: hypothetical protein DEH22_14190 [Chloroflexi bacterium]|nr:hypothetical protein [Chloroflexota bacterium]